MKADLPLIAKRYDRIDDIDEASWNRLAEGASVTLSYSFRRAIERAGLPSIAYHYLLFFEKETLVAIAPCTVIQTDLALFSGRRLKSLLGKIRSWWPNFLKIRVLECGSPVTINTPQFITSPDLAVGVFSKCLQQELHKLSRQEGALLYTIRDFETGHGHEDFTSVFKELGIALLPSYPNTYLDISWGSKADYYGAMRSHYRHKLKKHIKSCQKRGITVRTCHDLAPLAEELCQQWWVVHDHARELAREELTPDFYRELAAHLGEESFALLFFQDEELIAHALLLRDGSLLRFLYMGRRYAAKDGLYFFVLDSIVQTAIDTGAQRLELGLTTYPIKQDFGATLVPIQMAIRIRLPGLNWILPTVYNALYQTPRYDKKRVFRRPEMLSNPPREPVTEHQTPRPANPASNISTTEKPRA